MEEDYKQELARQTQISGWTLLAIGFLFAVATGWWLCEGTWWAAAMAPVFSVLIGREGIRELKEGQYFDQ